jgi:hypothetical protein
VHGVPYLALSGMRVRQGPRRYQRAATAVTAIMPVLTYGISLAVIGRR